MAFTPRTFTQIRDDMWNFIRMQTNLTDFQIGSVIRTMVEASALEDDEQYYQMSQLLDSYNISTASGQDLYDRLKEYNLLPLQASPSSGVVYIANSNQPSSTLAFTANLGATSIIIEDSSKFPTTGFPATIRIGEGTIKVLDTTITANDTSTGELTLSLALTQEYDIAEMGLVRVTLVSGTDIQLGTGIRVQVPATGTNPAITFVSTTNGTIIAGNYYSTPIRVKCETPGTIGNVGSQKITKFASSPAFDGAEVSNPNPISGGRDLETDADFRDRGYQHIQSLSKGNTVALTEAALGVTDPVTEQKVQTASIIELFDPDEVLVYVDDGTGFVPDSVTLPIASLSSYTSLAIQAVGVAEFPSEGYVLVSPDDDAQTEIVKYSSIDYSTAPPNEITLTDALVNSHDSSDEVVVVDVLSASTELGERRFRLTGIPVVRGSLKIWVRTLTGVQLQTEGTHYRVDRGTGDVEFATGLLAGSMVVANYTYYTGLIATVQKVLSGDPNDQVNYPGVAAKGVHVVVETPIIRRITVRLAISAMSGYQEINLVSSVKESVEGYINSLGIGQDVIIAEIIRRCMQVTGVKDVSIVFPSSNLVVLENELPRAVDALGNSLVTVN
jgi:uncharacterized phage protein gp47/JayE